MGNSTSQLEKELGNDFPEGEHYVGFENKNAICYSNSVIQALYYCEQFRRRILEYRTTDNPNDNPVLLLQEVFLNIQNHKKKVGVINYKKLMSYVKKSNEMFKGDYHQDCHEFLIWFLNDLNDALKKLKKNPGKTAMNIKNKEKTWLENIFEGTLTSQTKCLNCKTISEINEPFLDLSIDIELNTSLTWCIKNFSHTEILKDNDKFRCDKCTSLQDAEKKILVNSLPNTLIIHLKRFKYDEEFKKLRKLTDKVAFPLDICIDTQKEPLMTKHYELYAIIVHLGPGIQFGHYTCVIKHHDRWFLFDDESITLVDERYLSTIFGNKNSSTVAYMLFYQLIGEGKRIPLQQSV